MAERREIPCTDCAEQRRVIEMGGDKFISCDPIPNKPGMCELVFELVFRPAAAAPATAKKRKAAPRKPEPVATRKRVAKKRPTTKKATTKKASRKSSKKSAKKARK